MELGMTTKRMITENNSSTPLITTSSSLTDLTTATDDNSQRYNYYYSPSSPSPPPPPQLQSSPPLQVPSTPCAACKILRRRCDPGRCMLAPYFPPTDPLKFATAHRVFGASNIIRLLQEVAEPRRADAVSSMVYEAQARVRDPVYGSAGVICRLQKQISELQAEIAESQAEILRLRWCCQHVSESDDNDGLLRLYMRQARSGLSTTTGDCQQQQLQLRNSTDHIITTGEAGLDLEPPAAAAVLQEYDDGDVVGLEELVSSPSPPVSLMQQDLYGSDLNNNNNNNNLSSSSYVCSNYQQQLMSPVWEPLWA